MTYPVDLSFIRYGMKTERSPVASNVTVWKIPPVNILGEIFRDSDESGSSGFPPKQPESGANNIKQTKPNAMLNSRPILCPPTLHISIL
jgi:hypothetical protein